MFLLLFWRYTNHQLKKTRTNGKKKFLLVTFLLLMSLLPDFLCCYQEQNINQLFVLKDKDLETHVNQTSSVPNQATFILFFKTSTFLALHLKALYSLKTHSHQNTTPPPPLCPVTHTPHDPTHNAQRHEKGL